jgi:hypothetical protein
MHNRQARRGNDGETLISRPGCDHKIRGKFVRPSSDINSCRDDIFGRTRMWQLPRHAVGRIGRARFEQLRECLGIHNLPSADLAARAHELADLGLFASRQHGALRHEWIAVGADAPRSDPIWLRLFVSVADRAVACTLL